MILNYFTSNLSLSQRLLKVSLCPVHILRHYQRSGFRVIQVSRTGINIYIFHHGLSESVIS